MARVQVGLPEEGWRSRRACAELLVLGETRLAKVTGLVVGLGRPHPWRSW
jgi:hypothetical protein